MNLGEILTECHSASLNEVTKTVKLAQEAQSKWSKIPWADRRLVLQRTADLLRKNVEDLSIWEVRDNGKSITEARADVLSCADTFEYFSGESKQNLFILCLS